MSNVRPRAITVNGATTPISSIEKQFMGRDGARSLPFLPAVVEARPVADAAAIVNVSR